MTTPNKILVELLDANATADALAERLHLPFLVIKAMLYRHVKEAFVSRVPGDLELWKLTDEGKALATSMQTSCTP